MTKPKLQLSLLILVPFSLFFFVLLTIYLFAFKNTFTSYSLTQSWKEYYSVDDWNLTMHAVADFDNDGQKDIITFTNCAFLSSVAEELIPSDQQCQEPGMSPIAFPDKESVIGQKLESKKNFSYQWLKKTYLVKTKQDLWKFYDMNGLQLRTFRLGSDNLFKEIEPSILDKIDVFVYQISHLGVLAILSVL